uniref:Uncharacterized protein n=1 Tax=Rousettus aegyptiacus TaxID=9407 RepID=A0A7J8BRV3_ROUAE|nr:hypothetical protein HJG63_009634 [Rousettus aegyptiacus]
MEHSRRASPRPFPKHFTSSSSRWSRRRPWRQPVTTGYGPTSSEADGDSKGFSRGTQFLSCYPTHQPSRRRGPQPSPAPSWHRVRGCSIPGAAKTGPGGPGFEAVAAVGQGQLPPHAARAPPHSLSSVGRSASATRGPLKGRQQSTVVQH